MIRDTRKVGWGLQTHSMLRSYQTKCNGFWLCGRTDGQTDGSPSVPGCPRRALEVPCRSAALKLEFEVGWAPQPQVQLQQLCTPWLHLWLQGRDSPARRHGRVPNVKFSCQKRIWWLVLESCLSHSWKMDSDLKSVHAWCSFCGIASFSWTQLQTPTIPLSCSHPSSRTPQPSLSALAGVCREPTKAGLGQRVTKKQKVSRFPQWNKFITIHCLARGSVGRIFADISNVTIQRSETKRNSTILIALESNFHCSPATPYPPLPGSKDEQGVTAPLLTRWELNPSSNHTSTKLTVCKRLLR